MSRRHWITYFIAALIAAVWTSECEADLRDEAAAAARRAVSFLTDHVSTEGGYLWRYSSDLSLREGEGIVTTQTVWVQPPGTPTVGEAFVRLYEATREKQFLDAALDASTTVSGMSFGCAKGPATYTPSCEVVTVLKGFVSANPCSFKSTPIPVLLGYPFSGKAVL